MKSRRTVIVLAVLLLAAAAVAAALYLSGRRPVTTSSRPAYEAYREAMENQRRFYTKEARLGFAKALSLDPEFAMAMLGLADVSEHDQAASLVGRAVRLKPRLNELERLRVDMAAAVVNGKREDVYRIAEEIHVRYPDDIRGAEILAMRALSEGRADRALEIFADLLATDPNNATAYNQIGYYYAFRGDYDKAIENLKKYQFMAPDQANPWDSMGEVQAYSGRYDEAIQNLHRALAIKPDFYESWGHIGVACEGKGDWAKAVESYERAAADAANDDQRAGFLGSAFRVAAYTRNQPEARRLAARIEALPKSKEYELNVKTIRTALVLLEGNAAEAERLLQELRPQLEASARKLGAKETPFYNPVWNWLMAHAEVQLGRTEEAMTLYRQMAEPPRRFSSFPERRWISDARAELARLLAERGDLDSAEKLLEANHKWNPTWAPARACEQAVAERRREKVLAAAK